MSLPKTLPTTRTPDPAGAPPLRWGILAPGGIARAFAKALREHTRQEVYAVGSRSPQKADAFARDFGATRAYDSYEALVSDPQVEAVYVASPHSHHAEHARLAIEADKPVLVEKAFARTAAEARGVVAAAREAGVPLMEAMWTRFLPHVDVIRQLLADGTLGELETLQADHGQWFAFDPTHRLYSPALAGGAMLDLGVYPVSFAHFVLGRPGRLVSRVIRTETGVDRQVSAVLDGYENHPHAHALINTTLAARTPTVASIGGSEARVELPGPFYCPQPVTLIGRDDSRLTSAEPTIRFAGGLSFEAAHFAQLVADGRLESPLLPLDETLEIMDVMDALVSQ